MSKEEYRAIRNQVQRLSLEDQFRLLEDLVVILTKKSRPQQSISDLEELGTVLKQIQQLSTDEQFRLLEDLATMLRKNSQPQHSILELEGLGKEIWEGVDVDEYIRESRGPHLPENDEQKNRSISQNFSQQTNDYLQNVKKAEIQFRTMAEEIVQKLKSVDIENRDSQVWTGLGEDIDQILKALRNIENTDLRSRNIGEKITQERGSWGG